MGHQVTTQPQLPFISSVLSDLPSHKVRWAQQQSILRQYCNIKNQAQVSYQLPHHPHVIHHCYTPLFVHITHKRGISFALAQNPVIFRE